MPEDQLVHVRSVLTLSVVNHGGSIYLKVPRTINTALRLAAGDNVQIGYMGKMYREPNESTEEAGPTSGAGDQ